MSNSADPASELPPRACRPAVYWFWSRIPSTAEAERQVGEIAAAGFGAVMIQARLAFPREDYLSPAYLEGYRAAVRAALAAGLEVAVYDEYNWISGHAGGHTVAGPEGQPLRERHLFWSTSAPGERTASVSEIVSPWLDGLGPAGARWVYEGGARRWDEWSLVAAVAHPRAAEAAAEPLEVTAWAHCTGGPDGCALTLAPEAPVPRGWVVSFAASARCASSRLINYLDPRAAERFLEATHERYARALDGLEVSAFSFDHPYGGFYTWREHGGRVGCSLMWDAEAGLLEDLELSPARFLHAVLHDAGPRGRAARCRFFAGYAARGIESFFGTLAAWTRAHGFGLTGHELLAHVGGWTLHDAFPELDVRTNFGGDYFAIDRRRSQTLVDAVNGAAQLAPRFGDSVARAHGRSRCIVEQYYARREPPEEFAAGEWELSLAELRVTALRLHLLGARRFLFHAYHQTDGRDDDPEPLANPRFDFPPAINFEPWFPWFETLAAESTALSAFIDGAEPIRDVALVYPLATVWAEGPAHAHGRRFGEWAELLARAGIGYDVIDDRALDRGAVRDGRVWPDAHAHGYAAVVLPGASTLPSPRMVEVLESLAATGGTVVATAPLPDLSTAGGEQPGLGQRIAAVSAVAVSDAVPAAVPPALRDCDTAPECEPGDGAGTLWRWFGRAGGGARVALLNDGPQARRVGVGAGEMRVEVTLEPGGLACLRLDAPLVLAQGWTLSAEGAPPVAIDPGDGWEHQGFETFAGIGTYRCRFDAPSGTEGEWRLELPVVGCAVSASLNGVALGERGWPPYRFGVPAGTLRATANELELAVANSAANRYYAGTRFAREAAPGGLGAAPLLMREALR